MHFFASLLAGLIALFGGGAPATPQANLSGFSDPFLSIQLAASPSNGNCLTTDGTNNAWGSCGSGGAGSSFSTTSADYWKTVRNFFSTTSADHWITSTTTLPTITTLANLGTVKTSLSGILKASSGVLSSASAGTDYLAPSALSDYVTWTNATSSLWRTSGLLSTASSTIGAGTQAGGLTISGGATTTGTFTLPSLTSGGLGVNSIGEVYKAATTTFSTGLTYANGAVTCDTASGAQAGCLAAADWTTFDNKIASTSLSASLPLSYNSSSGAFTIADAVANGSTKGAATFVASDFDASSGNISIDYTNGQAASGSNKGFLTASDWTAFNAKQAAISAPKNALLYFDGSSVVATSSQPLYVGSLNATTTATSTFTGGIQAKAIDLTSTSATSTAANGLNLTGGCFSINNTCITSGATSPGGLTTQVQFNDSSAFGGDAGLTYNKTTDSLTALGTTTADGFTFGANSSVIDIIQGSSNDMLIRAGGNLTFDAPIADLTINGGGNTTVDAGTGDITLTSTGGAINFSSSGGTGYLFKNGSSNNAILDASLITSSNKTASFPNLTGVLTLGSYATGFLNGSIPFGSSGLLATSSGLVWSSSLSRLTATHASTTALTVSGTAYIGSGTGLLLSTSGAVSNYAGTSCTNQFVRSLSASGAATCATVSSGDVSLANLTATDSTLTFSGTYNGSTARTIGLNLGNANTWTALQTFSTNGIALTNLSSGNMLLSLDASKNVVATSTPTAAAYLATSTTATSTFQGSLLATLGGSVGIGTSSPWTRLAIGAGGGIIVPESKVATSSTITLDWRTANQQLVQMGAGSMTVNFSNYLAGQKLAVVVCNPNASGGTLTWGDANILWAGGTAPTRTTTQKKCDVFSFLATVGTSTSSSLKVFGAQTANF